MTPLFLLFHPIHNGLEMSTKELLSFPLFFLLSECQTNRTAKKSKQLVKKKEGRFSLSGRGSKGGMWSLSSPLPPSCNRVLWFNHPYFSLLLLVPFHAKNRQGEEAIRRGGGREKNIPSCWGAAAALPKIGELASSSKRRRRQQRLPSFKKCIMEATKETLIVLPTSKMLLGKKKSISKVVVDLDTHASPDRDRQIPNIGGRLQKQTAR